VFKDGKILCEGEHRELLENCIEYQKLSKILDNGTDKLYT